MIHIFWKPRIFHLNALYKEKIIQFCRTGKMFCCLHCLRTRFQVALVKISSIYPGSTPDIYFGFIVLELCTYQNLWPSMKWQMAVLARFITVWRHDISCYFFWHQLRLWSCLIIFCLWKFSFVYSQCSTHQNLGIVSGASSLLIHSSCLIQIQSIRNIYRLWFLQKSLDDEPLWLWIL